MTVKAVSLSFANEFVNQLHRHHKAATGHKFSLGAFIDDKCVGVVICGRPVARMTDHLKVIEVTRLCTDGTKNVCSKLYGQAARAAKELGYEVIQTFILESEPGKSLKASGWKLDSKTSGGSWARDSRKRIDKAPIVPKFKYVKGLK